jgi:hypothetical protein
VVEIDWVMFFWGKILKVTKDKEGRWWADVVTAYGDKYRHINIDAIPPEYRKPGIYIDVVREKGKEARATRWKTMFPEWEETAMEQKKSRRMLRKEGGG